MLASVVSNDIDNAMTNKTHFDITRKRRELAAARRLRSPAGTGGAESSHRPS